MHTPLIMPFQITPIGFSDFVAAVGILFYKLLEMSTIIVLNVK